LEEVYAMIDELMGKGMRGSRRAGAGRRKDPVMVPFCIRVPEEIKTALCKMPTEELRVELTQIIEAWRMLQPDCM